MLIFKLSRPLELLQRRRYVREHCAQALELQAGVGRVATAGAPASVCGRRIGLSRRSAGVRNPREVFAAPQLVRRLQHAVDEVLGIRYRSKDVQLLEPQLIIFIESA